MHHIQGMLHCRNQFSDEKSNQDLNYSVVPVDLKKWHDEIQSLMVWKSGLRKSVNVGLT